MKMRTKHIALTRLLPKTGQELIYRAGDDGTYQAGWWKGKTVANNKTRFIAKTIDGDDVVIDLATGLMWAADGDAAGCNNGGVLNWNEAIDYAEGLDFAGFTDWRIPNINELSSIVDYSEESPAISQPPFANTYSGKYLSSTTFVVITSLYFITTFLDGISSTESKITANKLRCVRGGV